MTRRAPALLFACCLLLLPACGDDDDDDRRATPTATATVAPPTATATPDPLAAACVASGGTVGAASCCLGTGDFAPNCGIGGCGCAPSASHEVARCECPSGSCWTGSACTPNLDR